MTRDPVVFNQRMSFQQILLSIAGELRRRKRSAQKFLGKIVLVDDDQRPVRVLDYHHLWEQRVATHRHVAVLGLGYVGLTLALDPRGQGLPRHRRGSRSERRSTCSTGASCTSTRSACPPC